MSSLRSFFVTASAFVAMTAIGCLAAVNPALADGTKTPVTLPDSKLPLRILTRPGASLYSDDTGATVLKGNLPTFSSYYVYTRPEGEALGAGTGWYEVGTDDKGQTVGWIKGEDLFEWKQTMCLTFSHPDGRSPVLMFDDDEYLETLISADSDTRAKSAGELYAAIDKASSDKTPLPEDFPVVSMEPKMAVDNTTNFTLMPILDHKVVEIDGREARLLDLVAVSSTEKDRKSSDLRTNQEYVNSATETSESNADKLTKLRFNVVWVVDTTRSMQPYIDKVLEVLTQVSEKISSKPELSDKISFGIWGYRDSAEIQGLEYVTNNYTPRLQNISDFLSTMATVKATTVDSVTFDEDMFSGLNDAITQTAWEDNAIRIIVMVGDAPGHQSGHKWNASGLDQDTLRAIATDRHVAIFAMHVMPGKAKKYNKIAASQFKTLATNPGVPHPHYWAIDAKDVKRFGDTSEIISTAITLYADDMISTFSGQSETAETAAADTETQAEDAAATEEKPAGRRGGPSVDDIVAGLHAATVTWLGNEVNVTPPRDIEAWVTDKDLQDSTRQSMEVNLLLTKAQLDAMSTLLKEVLEAGENGQVSGEDFFTSLQAASAVAARDPDSLANAQNLGASGLIPDFLSNLPYKSRLMEMNNDLWSSWGPDEQNAFLSSLESKIAAYSIIHDDTALWVPLNPGDDPNDYVHPVQLELMP